MRSEPPLELYGRAGATAGLVLRRGTVPGRIERVDVLDGSAVVSTTTLTPPVDGASQDAVLDLTPWRRTPAHPLVVVLFRRHQPASRRPAPLARSSFRLHPGKIGVPPMSQATPDGATAPVEGPDLISASFDFGTSRAVCGVFDRRRVSDDDAALPSVGTERARRLLPPQLIPVGDSSDPAQEIEDRTIGVPLVRAAAWREVFGCAPLDVHHLSHTRPRSSDLVVSGGTVDFASDATGERIRGVKRALADLDMEVAGTGLRGRDLFRQVYARFAQLVASELELPHAINTLSVTFPAKLPPDKRDDLLAELRPLAGKVEMNIDEAVAAAGFSMMKRFGMDPLLGVEAFTLQARCPEGGRAWEDPDGSWGEAHAWHENLLVVDLGGGTTDVALVKVAVVDATPAGAGRSPGRFYQLQPQVLASGGRLNLGGDQITAEVFKLLREKLEIRPGDTRFKGVEKSTARRQLFNALWEAAEQVKTLGLASAAPAAVRVVVTDPGSAPGDSRAVPLVWPAPDGGTTAAKPTATEVTVTAGELAERVRGPIAQIAWLAGGIARGGLDTLGNGSLEAVDRVLLSGGSMQAATLRRGIEDALRQRFKDDGIAATFEVEFDPEFTKTGTALGAVYLDAVADLSPSPDDPNIISELQRGTSFLDVDASRLHVNLAADFHLRESTSGLGDVPVFRRGQRLVLEPGGRAYATSPDTYLVRATLDIHRFDVSKGDLGDSKTGWASSSMLQDEADELGASGVTVRFEIDQDERITLLLCQSEPSLLLEGQGVDTGHVPEGLVVPPVEEGGLPTVRYALYDNVYQVGVGVQRDREPLVHAGTPIPPGGLLRVFGARRTTLYWKPDGPAPEGPHREFGTITDVPRGHIYLSLDTAGRLRFHTERPAWRTVARPLDLLTAEPGHVYQEVMQSGVAYDESKDPFSGTL
ncbi:acetate and sugar kinases/Hsc70/actin family protein [Streptomyces spongiae]|uniref:Hsp70 family protein n=1 Tax=Streptomyces spongiae TaxID=565072 RepID=A0A5N8XQ13_9ACTN|nr:hypothetical protein [Streptomyces spongiae]MPY61447.1 hypothetical protein [Streptomyces spongiae]